jgi:hypothetical protein
MNPRPFSNNPGIPDSPLLHKSWHNPGWPSNLLNVENIIHYFCDESNPFYDRQSDNQTLIMQGIPMDRLSKMNGIQFSLVHVCGPLFVIGKLKRASETNFTPICYYYCMDGTVYQCPDLYTFIQSRLAQTTNPLREALTQASKYSRFDVNKGYTWEFDADASKSAETVEEEKEKKSKKSWYQDPNKVRSSQYQWKRADRILHMTLHRYPPGSGMHIEGPPRMEIDTSGPGSVASRQTPMPQQLNSIEPASFVVGSKPATPASNNTTGGPASNITGGAPTPGGGLGLSAPNSHLTVGGPSSVSSRNINSPAMRKSNGTPSKIGR